MAARRHHNFNVKFGFVVEHEGKIVHFCGYESAPSQVDIDNLSEELLTDSEFGLEGKKFKIRLATQEELHYFREVMRGGVLMEGRDDINKLPIPAAGKRIARMSGRFSTSPAKPELYKKMIADLVNNGNQAFVNRDAGEKTMGESLDQLVSSLLDE
jgi:hypothetical protein